MRLRSQARLGVHLTVGSLALVAYVAVVVPVSWFRLARRRVRGLRPAILWGPIPIPNTRYSALADRLYGYRSESLVYSPYAITPGSHFDHVADSFSGSLLGRQVVPYAVFLWAGLRFDIFGFFFDGGLLWSTPFWRAELTLLKLARKRIVVYPYGSDARLPSMVRPRGGWNAYTDVLPGAEDRIESEVLARLNAFARHADVMLGCADVYEELPRCDGILRYPFDLNGWEPADADRSDRVRIVHAPNHRHYKGTRYLIQAVEELQADGLAVELNLVEGVSNDEARLRYREADIVADQFLIGAYALFAIEGMALGKPVLCYLNPQFQDVHPEWHECPIVSVTPDTLADELRRLVLDGERRRALGAAGPAYVRKYHSLESVGADMDAIYRSL